jgi:hypothetical protein
MSAGWKDVRFHGTRNLPGDGIELTRRSILVVLSLNLQHRHAYARQE